MDKLTGTAADIVTFLMAVDREKVWDLTEHKVKRSLSQNSYYWVLVGKVAQKTGISSAEIHNRNLRDLGKLLRINDELVPVYLPDDDESEKTALRAETYHLKPTSSVKVGKNDKVYRCYVMLRGSSTFNVEEMSALVDLMIQEAKAQGIETITPAELAHMREIERNAEKNKGNSNNSSGKTSG